MHGISTERARDEGMPLAAAVSLLADAVVSAGRRGVPLAGMKLDYDLTMLETQAVQLCGRGIVERGWCGPVLDAGVIDRHFDPDAQGPANAGRPVRSLRHRDRARTRRIRRCDRVHGGALRPGLALRSAAGVRPRPTPR